MAIIGLIASIMLVGLNGLRAKARDTKRKAEISQFGRFLVSSCYVPDAGPGEYDFATLIEELKIKNPQYASSVPQTPRDPKTGTETESFYKYTVTVDKKCALYANLENKDERVSLPSLTAPTPGGGTGVLQAASDGWNGTNKYFQVSN